MIKTTKKAFTLIELMIVVAIIAIIAAIAIPNLLAAKMSANETAAIGSLNAVKNAQTLFSERDIDGDGAANYWSYDVFGLYAIENAGQTAIKLIQDPATANSDANPAVGLDSTADDVFNNRTYNVAFPEAAVPKQGYFMERMDNGMPSAAAAADGYDLSDPGHASAGTEYCFSAYPQVYNTDGVKTYIVNNQGVVYMGDAGAAAAITDWPGENPQDVDIDGSGDDAADLNWVVAK